MGCQESILCINKVSTADRAKATILKRTIKQIERPANQGSLEQDLYEMTDQDWDMVEDILLNHQLLFKARGYANKQIMNRLQSFKTSPKQVIFKKGDPSDYFYIIIHGTIQISDIAQDKIKTISRGAYFGDIGIYSKATRSATATSVTNTHLLGLKKENFLRISLELSKRAQAEVFSYIKNIPMFKNLNLQQKHKIAYLAQQLKFKTNAVVFKRGQSSNCLYVVKTGKILLTIPGKDSIEVRPKQGFGESCLSESNAQRHADATCLEPTILLTFSKTDILKYIGKEVWDLQVINKFIWALKHDKTLKISPLIMESMIELKEIKLINDKEVLAEKGSPIKHFLISLQGGINSSSELQVFNTDYLLDIKYQTQQLIKNGTGRVAFISIEAIEKLYNRKFNSLIDLNHTIWKQIQSVTKIQEYVANLTLNSFRVIDTKGVGDCTSTLKIQTQSNIDFAMRVVQKYRAIIEEMQQTIINLRNIGGKLTHPLIAKQYRIFSDQYRIFFLSRWVEGQDLYDLVQRQRKLSLGIVKHFAACIINIMQYLHCRRIVWRQLKIESFVIDYQGYLTLVDLMHLEQLSLYQTHIDNPKKATLFYLAPQVMANHGHAMETDFWSLGVIIYRMLVGEFPYAEHISHQDQHVLDQISQQIQTKPLFLPNWLTSDAKMILKLLLNPQPFERSLISFTKLKSMSFFKDYDWLGLIEKKIKSVPYLPKKSPPKHPQPISVVSWMEHQNSLPPPLSVLDEIEYHSKNQIK